MESIDSPCGGAGGGGGSATWLRKNPVHRSISLRYDSLIRTSWSFIMVTERSLKEEMTITAIEGEKWKAVDLPLPGDASPKLLTAARNAAQECANDARRIVRANAHSEEAEDVGYAAEMQHAEGQALDRIDLIDSRLQGATRRFPQP